MPILKKIVVQDFRNIVLQELEFSPNVNCISGGNGEGKTNLLDAIYYLAMTKSAQGGGDRFNFRYGTGAFALSGQYEMNNGISSRFAVQVSSNGEKKVLRDDKPYGKISAHIGTLPIVMVSPADISMVSESGEERRKFVNAVLSQMDSEYLSSVQQYNRLLLQRNKLLKEGKLDNDLLDVIDMRMSRDASLIYERRKSFCTDLLPIVREYYKEISGGLEEVGIEYRSDLSKMPFEELMKNGRERDMALRYTASGVQRDDFIFTMNSYPIRKCGSQGQQKSFLVALKFAQYELMKKRYGFPPTLLLDDLFDKLDMNRVGNLLRMVAGKDFGQIFLSDTNKVRISSLVDAITADRRYLEAKEGTFNVADGKE